MPIAWGKRVYVNIPSIGEQIYRTVLGSVMLVMNVHDHIEHLFDTSKHWIQKLKPMVIPFCTQMVWSTKGMITLCEECHHALMKQKVMPKYALANWLYYGRQYLPLDVSAAFRTASQMELRLIARARASNICYMFYSIICFILILRLRYCKQHCELA